MMICLIFKFYTKLSSLSIRKLTKQKQESDKRRGKGERSKRCKEDKKE